MTGGVSVTVVDRMHFARRRHFGRMVIISGK
jgi:hypothetical protein